MAETATKTKFYVHMRIEGKNRIVNEDGSAQLLTDTELAAYEKQNLRLSTNEFDALTSQQSPQALAKRGGNPLYDAVIADLTKRIGALEELVTSLSAPARKQA